MNEGVNELMNERMKYMKRIIMILMAAALIALPAMAQSFGNKRSVENNQQAAPNFTTTQPFRSTSAMQTSGSVYSATPVLNENGIAAYGNENSDSGFSAKDFGHIRRDPGTEEEFIDNQPLGDAVLPLMIMALAFCGVVYLRRKKALNR